VSDLRQMYLTEQNDEPTYGCPDHPDWALMAIVQQTRTAPVTVTKEGDSFNVEHSPIAEFIHDMATEVTVAPPDGEAWHQLISRLLDAVSEEKST